MAGQETCKVAAPSSAGGDGERLPLVCIFSSIDGEVNGIGQGVLSTFIRLAGCNLRCWGGRCDTPQGLSVTENTPPMSVGDIVTRVTALDAGKTTITGGEPLLYLGKGLETLISALGNRGIRISVETNGSVLPPAELGRFVDSWVVDHKCPSTGETGRMVPVDRMAAARRAADYIKFVVADAEDYEFARSIARECARMAWPPRLAFSPKADDMELSWLADRIIRDRLHNVQFNLQIHKVIWPGYNGEV
ncbi:MAG: 7-carboxy-7-deazaguanine synthase QueE [Desulfovibrio sp.]|jgi:7-carboxy-7-deazaguanine synthase|nr:7-carboxy-7-deazaguanine synthase QueE [Desulfovibrio sp.]